MSPLEKNCFIRDPGNKRDTLSIDIRVIFAYFRAISGITEVDIVWGFAMLAKVIFCLGHMLLHLGTDELMIFEKNTSMSIARAAIEQDFPKFLKQWSLTHPADTIHIISGPGSYTILRIGALCLNLLQTLSGHRYTLLHLNKLEVLQQLRHKGKIPPYCLVWIGQQKNLRRYDLQDLSYTTLTGEEIPVDTRSDEIRDFTTQSVWTDRRPVVDFGIVEKSDLERKKVDFLEPDYIVEASIG